MLHYSPYMLAFEPLLLWASCIAVLYSPCPGAQEAETKSAEAAEAERAAAEEREQARRDAEKLALLRAQVRRKERCFDVLVHVVLAGPIHRASLLGTPLPARVPHVCVVSAVP